VLFGSLPAIGLWEFWRPRRLREFPALRRRLGNIGFWIVNLVLAALFFPQATSVRRHIEALSGISLPAWPSVGAGLSLVVGFLLLDLLRYLVHRCEHSVLLFWRYHALHHSDPDVDVTTSVRHHPVEYMLASAVYWLSILVLDIPAAAAMAHGLAVFGTAAIQHGNLRLPQGLERWLQPVLVTVDMHRIHHSIAFDQANSNYGAVLSVWDRLFKTHRQISATRHDSIVFGVSELPRQDCLKPSNMILTPWLLSRAMSAVATTGNSPRRSAEVAGSAMPQGRRRVSSGR
jgi:sterol desaturase/sphingolipid hydroxylase (fatty acid hydroxylase superfamily)